MTPASLSLFLRLAADAGNWNGQPLVDCTPAEKGNLSHLKTAGLITTFFDRDAGEGCSFASFTPAGMALAKQHGIDLTGLHQYGTVKSRDVLKCRDCGHEADAASVVNTTRDNPPCPVCRHYNALLHDRIDDGTPSLKRIDIEWALAKQGRVETNCGHPSSYVSESLKSFERWLRSL